VKFGLIFALGGGMLLSGIMVGLLRGDMATVALMVGGCVALVLAGFIDDEERKKPGARP
jgi:hypothetical protein